MKKLNASFIFIFVVLLIFSNLGQLQAKQNPNPIASIYYPQDSSARSVDNITIAINNSSLTLTWSEVAGASSYKVYSSLDPELEFVEVLTGTFTGTSWTAPLDGAKRFYYVASLNTQNDENYVLVEEGTFNNGTSNITLSSFYISKYEVTQAEYEAVIGSIPEQNQGVGDNYPVHKVTWQEAVEYCNALSLQEELTPCYNTTDWSYDFTVNGYRLPTEMEWMFAAKGGNETDSLTYDKYAGTDSDAQLTNYAWYTANNPPSGNKEVGLKLPNQLGLYDMSGNVWEWTNDRRVGYEGYSSTPQTDPLGSSSGTYRVVRGGSSVSDASSCKVTYRRNFGPSLSNSYIGFRLARSIGVSPPQQVVEPIISPTSGTYDSAQTISITCETEDANIYYTLDGTDPTESSLLYTGTFELTATTTVKAIAYKDGWDASAIVTAEYEINISVPVPEGFVLVESGTFNNGTSDVTLSSFYMGKYEVTQAEYQAVMYTTPSYFLSIDKPVEQVTWLNAVQYCNMKSFLEGLTPCYNTTTWSCDLTANGYRLPTEMEWMFAAKGGNEGLPIEINKYAGTNVETELPAYAWYSLNAEGTTHPVGAKEPNQLGIYDMSGNVWEWCNDWYSSSYSSSPQTDPVGPPAGTYRVRRGGSWTHVSHFCKVTTRAYNYPYNNFNFVGFRLVRSIGEVLPQEVADPIISPTAGTYDSAQTISITCETEGANIYYTLDGTDPHESSSLYTGNFELTATTTVKAIAYKDGWDASSIVTAEYEINISVPVPEGFVLVESGTFNNSTSNITLSSFYMGKYEVTQAEYEAVMGTNPSQYSGNANNPVDRVSWFNAIEYCNRRSMQEDLTPCYSYLNNGTNPDNWPVDWNTNYLNLTNVSCNWDVNGYRLPSEAEWEFTARGGNQTHNYTYSGSNTLGDVAWFWDNTGGVGYFSTHTVGSKAANELGIYDMTGNVVEWCWDIYSESYASGDQTNPHGVTAGEYLVVRGGGWSSSDFNCTVSVRNCNDATMGYSDSGFRLARSIVVSPPQQVADPIIFPTAGIYDSAQTISIICETEEATIYYTIDGSNPTESSPIYIGTFELTATTTVKAIAYKDGREASAIISAGYVINIPGLQQFILIEGGTFNNGTTNVTVNGFYMSNFEVTQAEYEALMGTNPSHSNYGIGDNYPVNMTSWNNAIQYCNAKSTQDGLIPCYDTDNWSCNFSATGYRLPTEMEWMFAAKGGNQQPSSNYNLWAGTNVESNVTNYAWYNPNNSPSGTKQVGTKLPNELGIYDMSGNVWEWCNDQSGSNRVIHGGGWDDIATDCRVAKYILNYPTFYSYNIGFRLVRRIDYSLN